jgi:hypothetical protein
MSCDVMVRSVFTAAVGVTVGNRRWEVIAMSVTCVVRGFAKLRQALARFPCGSVLEIQRPPFLPIPAETRM